MPHIHTHPNQHDMTVSAYVLLQEDDVWKCLVHLHKKVGKLMQVGGHIELDQTPWQAIAHELEEETGYAIDELDVLQPFGDTPIQWGNIVHPLPFSANTHNVGDDHYHSDNCYGFIAKTRPSKPSAEGESDDLRWLSLGELRQLAEGGEALQDVAYIYQYLVDHVDAMVPTPASSYSLKKPENVGITYQTGKPSESRSL